MVKRKFDGRAWITERGSNQNEREFHESAITYHVAVTHTRLRCREVDADGLPLGQVEHPERHASRSLVPQGAARPDGVCIGDIASLVGQIRVRRHRETAVPRVFSRLDVLRRDGTGRKYINEAGGKEESEEGCQVEGHCHV